VQGQGLVDVVVVLPERGHVGGLRRRSDEGGRAGGASPEQFFTATLVIGSMTAAIWLSVPYFCIRPSSGWDGQRVTGAAPRCRIRSCGRAMRRTTTRHRGKSR
jgi:hypothetical protein